MNETFDGGEQLSEEEIAAQVQELLTAIELYNNLIVSVLHNQHYMTKTFESDPSLTEGDDEDSGYFKNLIEETRNFSVDLREEMADPKIDIKAEDGYALRDIMCRAERKMADLMFLREYLPKMEKLYKKLHYKNGVDGDIRWSQEIMGTHIEEKN